MGLDGEKMQDDGFEQEKAAGGLHVVTEFIRYANLVLFDSLDTQELTASLEMMYGQDSEADDSEVFQQGCSQHEQFCPTPSTVLVTFNFVDNVCIFSLMTEVSVPAFRIPIIPQRTSKKDDKVKSLLLNLLCCSRLMPEQVLRNDCFLTIDVVPVSLHPGEEYELQKKPKFCDNRLKKSD
ncbi:LOW QUALITY PROTEIN: uncharacterized protein GJ701_000751 [Geothlypis trichas]